MRVVVNFIYIVFDYNMFTFKQRGQIIVVKA